MALLRGSFDFANFPKILESKNESFVFFTTVRPGGIYSGSLMSDWKLK